MAARSAPVCHHPAALLSLPARWPAAPPRPTEIFRRLPRRAPAPAPARRAPPFPALQPMCRRRPACAADSSRAAQSTRPVQRPTTKFPVPAAQRRCTPSPTRREGRVRSRFLRHWSTQTASGRRPHWRLPAGDTPELSAAHHRRNSETALSCRCFPALSDTSKSQRHSGAGQHAPARLSPDRHAHVPRRIESMARIAPPRRPTMRA